VPRFPATAIEKKIAETPANAKKSTNKRNFSIQYRTSHQLTVLCARDLADTRNSRLASNCVVGPGEVATLRADNDLQKGAGD
jgi:hypothetical protein